MNTKRVEAASFRSSPMESNEKQPASSEGQGAGFATSAHGFKRVDCGSLARVVECKCGCVISGYLWREIDAEIEHHLAMNSAPKSANETEISHGRAGTSAAAR